MIDSEVLEWNDFDEIYNTKISHRVPPSNGGGRDVSNRKLESAEDVCLISTIDDFPFVRNILYNAVTSKLRRSPVVSKSYEEAFMVEGSGHNACKNTINCECFKMFGYVMRRFQIPSDASDASDKRASINDCKLCVLCIRNSVLALYLDYRSKSMIPTRSIQPYRNIIGVRGEYTVTDCIQLEDDNKGGHLIEPFVLHVRTKYDSRVIDGVQRVFQIGYGENTPEVDFR